jgi:hypothetical protein
MLMDDSHGKRQTWLVCLGLALAVLTAYSPLWHCQFVLYDDNDYVASNDMVKQGVSWAGIVWAFSTFYASNWHPLTWISHMVDCQLYGMNPAGHHITSLLLHLANSILLFLLLQRMTGARWPSALTAALFALHPLHVESVAWVSERKDVLSTLFWMLSVGAYVRYAEHLKSQISNFKFFYIASVVLSGLGLMCKPMLVTLPFVLILLDYWPARRPVAGGKDSVVHSGRCVVRRNLSGAAARRRAGVAGRRAAGGAFGERARCLRALPGKNFLASRSGGVVSASPMAGLGGGLRRRAPGADNSLGDLASPRATVFGGGLAVVSGDAGARHRVGSRRDAVHGRPLRLSSERRSVYHDNLGGA